jgi:hypothetical protein
MVPIARVPRIGADTDLWAALEMLDRTGLDALLIASTEDEPVLLTRRSAARLVHEKAEEQQRTMPVAQESKRGRFRGR